MTVIDIMTPIPQGGCWHTALNTANAWSKSPSYSIRMTCLLGNQIPITQNFPTSILLSRDTKLKKKNRFLSLIILFYNLSYFFISKRPLHIIAYSMQLGIVLAIYKTVFFWRPIKFTIIADTHISCHLSSIKTIEKPLFFKFLSFFLHNSLFYKIAIKQSSQVITLTKNMENDLINNFGLSKKKSSVIPIMVDRLYYKKLYLPPLSRNKTILYVGRLSKEKNISDIIKSFSNLLEEDCDVKLLLVGDGPELTNLRQIAQQTGASSKIIFKGHQHKLKPFYEAANCLVLTSHFEGFPLVIAESAASGTPVISYDSVGAHDLIINNENGFIVPTYDIEKLSRAIKKSLQKTWDHEKIKETAEIFHPDKVEKQYNSFLSTFMNNRN